MVRHGWLERNLRLDQKELASNVSLAEYTLTQLSADDNENNCKAGHGADRLCQWRIVLSIFAAAVLFVSLCIGGSHWHDRLERHSAVQSVDQPVEHSSSDLHADPTAIELAAMHLLPIPYLLSVYGL